MWIKYFSEVRFCVSDRSCGSCLLPSCEPMHPHYQRYAAPLLGWDPPVWRRFGLWRPSRDCAGPPHCGRGDLWLWFKRTYLGLFNGWQEQKVSIRISHSLLTLSRFSPCHFGILLFLVYNNFQEIPTLCRLSFPVVPSSLRVSRVCPGWWGPCNSTILFKINQSIDFMQSLIVSELGGIMIMSGLKPNICGTS